MCVCTISSGSRSLTKFKVDEDSSQIKILDIYVRVVFKILGGGFLSTCNNGYSYQIPQNGTFEQTDEPISAYLFRLSS